MNSTVIIQYQTMLPLNCFMCIVQIVHTQILFNKCIKFKNNVKDYLLEQL